MLINFVFIELTTTHRQKGYPAQAFNLSALSPLSFRQHLHQGAYRNAHENLPTTY